MVDPTTTDDGSEPEGDLAGLGAAESNPNHPLFSKHLATIGFGQGGVNLTASMLRYLAECSQLSAEDVNLGSDATAICTDSDTRLVGCFVDSDPESIDDVNDQLPYELDRQLSNRTIVFDNEGGGKNPAVMLDMIDDPARFVDLLRNALTVSGDVEPDVLFLNAGVTGANGASGLMMIPELAERGLLFENGTPEIYATAVTPLGHTEDIDTLALPGGPADEDSWRADIQADYLDAGIEGAYGNVPLVLERAQEAVDAGHYAALFVLSNAHLLAMQAVNNDAIPVRTLQDHISEHRANPINDPHTKLYKQLNVPHDSVPVACNKMFQTLELPLLINRANLPGATLSRDADNHFDGAEVRAALQGNVVMPGFFGVQSTADLQAYFPHSDIPEEVTSHGTDLEIALSAVAKMASLLIGAPHAAKDVNKFEFILHARDFDLDGMDWQNVPERFSRSLPGYNRGTRIRTHTVDGLDSAFPVGQQEFAAWAYACVDDCVTPYRDRLEQLRSDELRRSLRREV